jgi:hypothetical protein
MSDPAPAAVWAAPQQPTDDASGAPRSRGKLSGDGAVVIGTFLVLGLVAGVLWWLLVDPAAYTKTRDGGVMSEAALRRQFSADGVYAVIAAVTGLVTGLVLTWWRSRDPLLTSVLLVLGAALAAAVMALTGHLLGPGDPATALREAELGAQVPLRLEVDTFSVYLVWPVAVLAGALVVLLNSAGPATSEVARGTTEPR